MGSILGLLAAGCGASDLWSPGCRSDDDCKLDRVCVQGVCQDPAAACDSDADCPEGQACLGGTCVECDRDRDGAEALACGGADCDDQNAGVRPGADELCGDGLDNDCDGTTDPAALCGEKCAGVRCAEGFACDPDTGTCVPVCSPDCADRACGPDGCDGSCGGCAQGERCSDAGQCVQDCRNECAATTRRCAQDGSGGFQSCMNWDADPCLEWSPVQPCPDGLACEPLTGQCGGCVPDCAGLECGPDRACGLSCGVCPPDSWCSADGLCVGPCQPECDFWGQTTCLDDRRAAECGDWDGDNCLEWSPGEYCPEGSWCDRWTGACVGACSDECTWGQITCWDEMSEASCEDWDGDGCSEWGQMAWCPEGYCDWSTGRCAGGCWDECDFWDQRTCLDDWSYLECGQWDNDYCLEWSEGTPCPNGGLCWSPSGEVCGGGCEAECEWGQQSCWDDYTEALCDDWDGDGCTEWAPTERCPEGSFCAWDLGGCAQTCTDDCARGEVRCMSLRRYLVCGDYDDDPCAEWSPEPVRCPTGTTCSQQAGGCVGACQDECADGERQCLDSWTWLDCGDFDGDGCLEFSPPMPCPADQPCDWNTGTCGGCQPLSCQELGLECGQADDGCGTWIDCGACADGETCLDGACAAGGAFGSPCEEQTGCVDGLTCTRVDDAHLGYCNRACSAADPCPSPFQCFAVAGQNWCVSLCGAEDDCAALGAWECVWFAGLPTGVCLPSLPAP